MYCVTSLSQNSSKLTLPSVSDHVYKLVYKANDHYPNIIHSLNSQTRLSKVSVNVD